MPLMSLLMIPLAVGCGDGDATKGDSTHDAVADTDVDGDGVAAEVDCDDNDPESTTVSIDGDCDGVLAEDDCDDSDSESTAVSVDGDCDGVMTDDDCDDEDASVSLCWKTIEAGRYHTCGITTADEVLCWGDDEFGQATPPQGIVFSSLSAGWENTCGLTETGTVECWGNNESGQSSPPDGVRFTAVTLGYDHGCGITTDGDVACWGQNRNGSTEPPDLSLTVYDSFSSIHAGGTLTCGVTTGSSRRVLCWGEPYWDAAAPTGMYGTDGVTYYTDVKTSGGHTCGLAFTPGDRPWVHCAGYNGSGECDTEDTGWVTSLEVFGPRTCAISRSESGRLLQCWGESDFVVDDVPPDHEFNTVTLGGWHACALTTDDKAVCWGDNERGQLMQSQAVDHIDARSP